MYFGHFTYNEVVVPLKRKGGIQILSKACKEGEISKDEFIRSLFNTDIESLFILSSEYDNSKLLSFIHENKQALILFNTQKLYDNLLGYIDYNMDCSKTTSYCYWYRYRAFLGIIALRNILSNKFTKTDNIFELNNDDIEFKDNLMYISCEEFTNWINSHLILFRNIEDIPDRLSVDKRFKLETEIQNIK